VWRMGGGGGWGGGVSSGGGWKGPGWKSQPPAPSPPALSWFYFLAGPRIDSLDTLAGVNPTFLRAGILSSAPVWGLRPIRAFIWRRRKVPRSGILRTLSFLTVLLMNSTRSFRYVSAWRLGMPPQVSASFFTISDFVIVPT